MGQIDSFKRVLGVAGQKTDGINAGIEVKEELPVPEKKSRRDKRSSLTVSPEIRRQIRLLSLWAAHKGVIKEETAEALLRSMIQSFLKKHTEAQAFLNEMS